MGLVRRALRTLGLPIAALAVVGSLSLAGYARAAAATTWSATAPLPQARSSATATVLPDGQVLVLGGLDRLYVPQSSAYLYDPVKQRWTQTAPMRVARAFHVAVLLQNGTVLVAGGETPGAPGSVSYTETAEVYNPATASWKGVASMHEPRGEFTGTLLQNGRVLVAGGVNVAANTSGFNINSGEVYDPAANRWDWTPRMPVERSDYTATLLNNGNVLLASGYRGWRLDPGPGKSSDPFAQAIIYNAGTGHWQATGDLFIQRWLHTATKLADGTVLVAGGLPSTLTPGNPTTPDAEVYEPNVTDPATGAMGRWVPVTPMPTGRADHQAVLLADGRVLVAGGTDTSGNLVTDSLVFNPAGDTWSDGGSMITGRGGFVAALLSSAPCGSVCDDVLVAGGSNGPGLISHAGTATAELFTPPPNTAAPGSTAVQGVPVPDTGVSSLLSGGIIAALGVTALASARAVRRRERRVSSGR